MRARRLRTPAVPLAAVLAAALTAAGCASGSRDAAATTTGRVTSGGAATTSTTATPPSGAAASGNALAYQEALILVVHRLSPSVVQISTQQGLGSGVVFDDRGDIVTNAHVVEGAKSFTVTTSSGKRYPATLVGAFRPDDLAVVNVRGAGLRAATFADSSKLQVGDIAVAIGNPLGLQSSVTEGIVSAFRTGVPEGNGVALPSMIQTSAPINPGNSGGALADIDGRVIGIPTLAATDPQLGGSAAPGIGFAIPSNLVRDIASQLIQHGRVVDSHRAYLGIQGGDTNGQGVYVGRVEPGTPAAQAGIEAGDVIVSVGGQDTPTLDALTSVLAKLQPGKTVAVTLVRQSGAKKTVHVRLGTYPGTS